MSSMLQLETTAFSGQVDHAMKTEWLTHSGSVKVDLRRVKIEDSQADWFHTET